MTERSQGGVWLKALSCMVLGALLAGPVAATYNTDGSNQHQACLFSDTGAVPITVELAVTSEEKQQGLMERTSLAEDAGMLFVYDELRPPSHAFWMYKTLIPLDIAFIAPEGTIRAIRSMVPCTSGPNSCASYPAGVSFNRALEMNAGFFGRNDIGVGDRFARKDHRDCQG
ncbi:DUF192 domain-containing protein [Marinobacter sp.]|uniref:DUF192 domain-containing protein n=1 Tax=Marinobacter sp. TaxID=50741 RepID=UPI003850EAD5